MAIRNDNGDENFDQLLKRCEKLYFRTTEWSHKNKNKFLQNEHHNELIKHMVLKLLRDIAEQINKRFLCNSGR